ncbi:MAG TPA: SulP family inorganic anion transporter [Ramlibacter sp.]
MRPGAGVVGQLSSGLIIGLSSVIYAVSYAALMFSGPLAPYLPYAITITLVTAAIAGLYGLLAEEPTLVSGPDANTSSVLAGILAVTAAAGTVPSVTPLNHAVAILTFATAFTAVVFLLIERFRLARLVRFIPFQVMAGFLASTGWLMASGGLNIIAGTPLTLHSVAVVLEHPWRPELLAGIVLTVVLGLLQRRFHPAVAIPAFMVAASLLGNLVLRNFCPWEHACAESQWFFPPFDRLQWLPPWRLELDGALLLEMLELLPSFMAVAFVGTLSLLLSMSSLELTYGRDFRLERALRLHGWGTALSSAAGGVMSVITIGRTQLCRITGGGQLSGVVSTAVAVGVLLGLGGLLAWIPKVALGALVLYLGATMLRTWLFDLRHTLPRVEWLQVVAILVCIVAFGYVTGFLAGLLAACIFFVVNYSRMPATRLDSTVATVRSSVIRSVADQAWLAQVGTSCRVGRFEGFVFFGVAHFIYDWYCAGVDGAHSIVVLDFSKARGIDHSAVAVLEKIVRTVARRRQRLILVLGDDLRSVFRALSSPAVETTRGFDAALERAEDILLAQRSAPEEGPVAGHPALPAFATEQDRAAFLRYLREVRLAPGDTLFQEGQASDEMYFVESGRLEVLKTGMRGAGLRLAKVAPGSLIGEIALYTGQPRSATIVATEPAVLLMLTREARAGMQAEQPALAAQLDHHVVLGLASTLLRANAAISLQVG